MADKIHEDVPIMFRETPGSVKSLRRSYKDRHKQVDAAAFRKEIMGHSVRSGILLTISLFDDLLRLLITRQLHISTTDAQNDTVFRFEGPLGTFSARLEIAYLFGFIDPITYEELDLFRELRNACAHSKQNITFSDPVLWNVAKRIFQPLGFVPLPTQERHFHGAVLLEVVFLIHTLTEGTRVKAESVMGDVLLAAALQFASPDTQTKQ